MVRRRLIQTVEPKGPHGVAGRQAKIYRDSEWDEYQVELIVDGVLQSHATYHTGDWKDAHDTAVVMVSAPTLVQHEARPQPTTQGA